MFLTTCKFAPLIYHPLMEPKPTLWWISPAFRNALLLWAPKLRPEAVGYNGNLLLFSTQIFFRCRNLISPGSHYNAGLIGVVHFEIYDPTGRDSRKLPQLHICQREEDTYNSALRLYNAAKSRYFGNEFNDLPEKEGGGRMCFSIVSYCVVGDDFVVETNFGKQFCLKLDSVDGDDGWRLVEEDYVFQSPGWNIVTPGGVCYDAFGANDHRRKEMKLLLRQEMDHGGEAGYVRFPLTSIKDGNRNLSSHPRSATALSLVKDDPSMPCIVQTMFDCPRCQYDNKLYWLLDVLKLNLEDDEGDNELVQGMKSFKFCVPRGFLSAYVLGLCWYNS